MPSFTINNPFVGNPFGLKVDGFIVPIRFEPLMLDLTIDQLVRSLPGSNIPTDIPRPASRHNGDVKLVHDPDINRQVAFVIDDHTEPLTDLIEAALTKLNADLPIGPPVRHVVIAPFQARRTLHGYTDEDTLVRGMAQTLKVIRNRSGQTLSNIKSVTVVFAPFSFQTVEPVGLFGRTMAAN